MLWEVINRAHFIADCIGVHFAIDGGFTCSAACIGTICSQLLQQLQCISALYITCGLLAAIFSSMTHLLLAKIIIKNTRY